MCAKYCVTLVYNTAECNLYHNRLVFTFEQIKKKTQQIPLQQTQRSNNTNTADTST